jgi:hypothetical protein
VTVHVACSPMPPAGSGNPSSAILGSDALAGMVIVRLSTVGGDWLWLRRKRASPASAREGSALPKIDSG